MMYLCRILLVIIVPWLCFGIPVISFGWEEGIKEGFAEFGIIIFLGLLMVGALSKKSNSNG